MDERSRRTRGHPARVHRMDRALFARSGVGARGMTPDLPERLGTVAFDLALRDGPDRSDLAGAYLPPLDLGKQRRRRQPESSRRLCEREHLGLTGESDALGMHGDVVGAGVDRVSGLEAEL